jgi:NADH dehydrogenase
MRTRVLLMIDWVKRGIFGRDLSKVSRDYAHCEIEPD